MRPVPFRLLICLQALACLALLWWICQPNGAPSAVSVAERDPENGPVARAGAVAVAPSPRKEIDEVAAKETSSRAAAETRALILGAARAAGDAPLAPEAAVPSPQPPEGVALPLIFGPVPTRVELGTIGLARLRQLQEGFRRAVEPKPGESASGYRQRWERAARLADGQLWPVFGQEVANAFANARQLSR